MSTTKVSIASNALLLLGASPIASFEEGSDRARLASNLWDPLRKELLRRHTWNCAIKRKTLAPEAGSPDFDFAYSFVLPSDFLRLLSIGTTTERPDYAIEGGRLLFGASVLRLRYVFDNAEPETWDAGLVAAMTASMTAAMAYPITQSATLAESKRQEFLAVLKTARAVDGVEADTETFGDFPLLASRG